MKVWPALVAAGFGLVLVQQQLLLRRPPRLLGIQPALTSSGPGALDLRFSRPMDQASLAQESRLSPAMPASWFGNGKSLRLLLANDGRVTAPITLDLAGLDHRRLPLPSQRWSWDPRPRIVAVVSVQGGQQVQLQHHDGRWQAVGPIWHSLPSLQVMGDGSGIVMAGAKRLGPLEVWRVPVRQRNLAPAQLGLLPPQIGVPQRLSNRPLLFAYLSSNQRGDLLMQSSSVASGQAKTQLWDSDGRSQALTLETSGPIRLVPHGGAMVVPNPDGLMLMGLPGQAQTRQILPGSRELSAFCRGGGRALLVHYRPDFSRSLELVEPGQPPRPLWQGQEGVAASACSANGRTIWLMLVDSVGQPRLQILALNHRGQLLQRRWLAGWELEPTTSLDFDASRNQLLLTLRPLPAGDRHGQRDQASRPAMPVLIDASSLKLEVLSKPILQAQWLPASG